MRCPCRKKTETTTYEACCEPYHRGLSRPATAEALMRSRYTAFVRHNAAYLRQTWHASTRPAILDFMPGQDWLQLKIVTSTTDGDAATVEFVARSRTGGRSHVLHETSRFVRENGGWLYVDGIIKQNT